MKVVVTGASGFLGRALVQSFARRRTLRYWHRTPHGSFDRLPAIDLGAARSRTTRRELEQTSERGRCRLSSRLVHRSLRGQPGAGGGCTRQYRRLARVGRGHADRRTRPSRGVRLLRRHRPIGSCPRHRTGGASASTDFGLWCSEACGRVLSRGHPRQNRALGGVAADGEPLWAGSGHRAGLRSRDTLCPSGACG